MIDIVVQRFGEDALAGLEPMRKAAQLVADAQSSGKSCLVVVTAMGHTTAELRALADRCGVGLSPRELSALLSCGESMSAPLFAMCLHNLGVRAMSLSASQAGLRFAATRAGMGVAVASVDPAHVLSLMRERIVPVVAGAQRILVEGEHSQLGSADLSAVALGAATSARVVELYTDDDAFSDGERQVDEGSTQRRVDYDVLLSLLERQGAPFLEPTAAEYAKKKRVPLRILPLSRASRSTLVKNPTLVPPSASMVPPVVDVFAERESNIRGYCRSFPVVFSRAKGALQWDEAGNRYVDFFSGAGALNYGHNPDAIKQKMLAYLEQDGVAHALDMHTVAKRAFLETFRDVILVPRGLDYKVQCCGPTGANSVEAALKLARLKTGRSNIGYFTGGWHGMTTACLSVCGNRENREAAGVPLPFTTALPYPDGPYKPGDALGHLTWLFEDPNSGFDLPAALILETVQGEGGIYVAPPEWLRGVHQLCQRHGVLLIADDIQVGCGRTGTFFSFEEASIVPDIVCLSKSIGGYGQPMALLLMRPEIDVWKPGQHTGTFRGNQLGFVAAAAALEFWRDPTFVDGIAERSSRIRSWLARDISPLSPQIEVRGRGMMWGIDVSRAGGPDAAQQIAAACFRNGLIIERCGRDDTVLKMMPPLNIPGDQLDEGLAVLGRAAAETLQQRPARELPRGRPEM